MAKEGECKVSVPAAKLYYELFKKAICFVLSAGLSCWPTSARQPPLEVLSLRAA